MNPPHSEPGVPRHHHHHLVHLQFDLRHHHHHLVHLQFDPRHHHHVHIHLCHHYQTHPLVPAPPAHLHHTGYPAPVFVPGAYRGAAPWQPEQPRSAVGEAAAEDPDAEPAVYADELVEEEEPVFVLTDEWAEFFANSDAKRRLAKQQKKSRSRK